MYTTVRQRLDRLSALQHTQLLCNSAIGVEKESLRVNAYGSISQAPHPTCLGAPLTHPYITTDYSEALTEFITPPLESIPKVLDFLRDTQQFVYQCLDEEYFWATSMPCVVKGETSIPIAKYGNSNSGQMKEVYRRGLGHRYGKVMQVISGVHFNYSLPAEFWPLYAELEENRLPLQDFISESYMHMIRNLQRYGWLVPYLFGASPAVCKSFVGDQSTDLEEFNKDTFYRPFATSLRMGDIGYQNNKEAESGFKANYNSLNEYIDSLLYAIETPCPEYEEMGVEVDGSYRQLNGNLLQIENEYYSTVRPKQILKGNEKPVLALKRRGIAYVELRSLDINAFDPLGINARQLQFLESFMVFCLLQESPLIDKNERIDIDKNELLVAHAGRDPQLNLQRDGNAIRLSDWANELCDEMMGVCELFDAGSTDSHYVSALNEQRKKISDPDLTPSARMLAEMSTHGEGFYQFAKRMSEIHHHFFANLPLNEEREKFFTQLATKSSEEQRAREAIDELPFREYLARYFSQT